VEPNQEKQNWYHQRFRRVPTIDQCYTDDAVCRFEADQQFRRDRMVDNEIVNILRQRFEDCTLYEAPDHIVKCKPLLEQYEKATENWFIKCKWNPYMGHLGLSFEWPLIDRFLPISDGDLGGYANAKTAYMKQKHRLIWERRHGPVGSGMKEEAAH